MVELFSVPGLFGLGFLVATLLMTAGLTWLGVLDRGPAPADADNEDESATGS